jgi:hypothetical protein
LIQTSPAELVEILKANNPEGLRELLRAAGLPESTSARWCLAHLGPLRRTIKSPAAKARSQQTLVESGE